MTIAYPRDPAFWGREMRTDMRERGGVSLKYPQPFYVKYINAFHLELRSGAHARAKDRWPVPLHANQSSVSMASAWLLIQAIIAGTLEIQAVL